MVILTAQMMDGQEFEVEVDLNESVHTAKERLSTVCDIHTSEITLFFDSIILSDNGALLGMVLPSDVEELEVVLVRTPTVGTKAVYWYDVWVDASAVTLADLELKDAVPWINLASSLYCLGECGAAWIAYRKAAQIAQNWKVNIDDEQLLTDPAVGKYTRILNRSYKRTEWRFDEARVKSLMVLLHEEGRLSEVATKEWNTQLPYCWAVINQLMEPAWRPKVSDLPGAYVTKARGSDKILRLEAKTRNSIVAELCVVESGIHPRTDEAGRVLPLLEAIVKAELQFNTSKNEAGDVEVTVSCTLSYNSKDFPAPGKTYGNRRGYGIPGKSKKNLPGKTKPAVGDSLDDWDDDWDDWDEDEES